MDFRCYFALAMHADFTFGVCCSALTRRCVGGLLYVSELCAGAMLRLAGYRPARAWMCAGAGRRGVSAILHKHIGFAMLFAGSPLGAEMWKPHCGLSGLSSFGARQSASLPNIAITAIFEQRTHAAQHSGTRRDLPESNLCSGKSGCMNITPTHNIVQTRAAPKRRGVGLHARSGVELAQPA